MLSETEPQKEIKDGYNIINYNVLKYLPIWAQCSHRHGSYENEVSVCAGRDADWAPMAELQCTN